ncbi:unnamed protein product [Didymodactylos carnosus]|uniref:Peptidoglycan-recognition protein n=1 Tax=Didymodactylos carnosus TaxID=1234261 RepID=A0A814AZA7_9BILA|nr:unnamed protein product [Didymodactylos carnosus]CAF0918845.1 unnamed protein product [Didymodactylos carnosus]CAF3530425.1 unnamed protein product [Didymodactylos carnosus]CAF3698573.1 unnamed protein product [Didymodactylos carnosus]
MLDTMHHCPSIVSRSGWGARAAKGSTKLTTPVSHVVIHHTTGATCTAKNTCISRMKGFQNYHMDTNGWVDIGYNFLVGEDGNIYEGRGWTLVGAHCVGYNSKSIGISVIGDYSSRLPVSKALTAVKALIKCGVQKGYIRSNYILRGHRHEKN